MTDHKYPRPPIVEAVLEFRFSSILSDRDLQRLRDRFSGSYPSIEEINTIDVMFEGAKKIGTSSKLAGFKQTAKNAQDVVVLHPNALTTARLAPYPGWEELRERAKENFDLLTKVAGRQVISRIGSRFVNRIDYPNELITNNDFSELLLFGVFMPSKLVKSQGPFVVVVEFDEASTGMHVKVQSGIAPPALLNHTSVNLDIDASIDHDIPLNAAHMWETTNMLRLAKNVVFENAITDRTRALFQ